MVSGYGFEWVILLGGLLPPAKFTQNMQVKRVMRNVRGLSSPVEQHFHLLGLQERNERLFYRALIEHAAGSCTS